MTKPKYETLSIEDFFNSLLQEGRKIHKIWFKYEIIECSDIQVKSLDGRYVNLKYVSRHKTHKDLYKILVKEDGPNGKEKSVIVTEDHCCMVYWMATGQIEALKPKDLAESYMVLIKDGSKHQSLIGHVEEVTNIGKTSEYVYDLEVDNEGGHCFYANDILVHNSQFINLACICDWFIDNYKLPKRICDWSKEYQKKFWDEVNDFVDKDLNPFVQDLVKKECSSDDSTCLRYGLEYLADSGIYESKKHYAVHKIFDDGDFVDKFKYTGIEVKKAIVPVEIKDVLKNIYDSTLVKDWKEDDYKKYVSEIYEKFKTLPVETIALWKGYNTPKDITGFLQLQKGAGIHVKASEYYNQLIEKFGLSKKYDSIRIGDKMRLIYVNQNNPYRINCIGFKTSYPEEFRKLFEIDYDTMFDKLVLDTLKGYRKACKFSDITPAKQTSFDISSL